MKFHATSPLLIIWYLGITKRHRWFISHQLWNALCDHNNSVRPHFAKCITWIHSNLYYTVTHEWPLIRIWCHQILLQWILQSSLDYVTGSNECYKKLLSDCMSSDFSIGSPLVTKPAISARSSFGTERSFHPGWIRKLSKWSIYLITTCTSGWPFPAFATFKWSFPSLFMIKINLVWRTLLKRVSVSLGPNQIISYWHNG